MPARFCRTCSRAFQGKGRQQHCSDTCKEEGRTEAYNRSLDIGGRERAVKDELREMRKKGRA